MDIVMKNICEIENGIILNVIVVDPDNVPDWCSNWPDLPEGGQIGHTYNSDGTTTAPPVDPDVVRSIRNSMLIESDCTQGADVPQSIKDAWSTYRQELRDLTDQSGFPDDVTWPTKPE